MSIMDKMVQAGVPRYLHEFSRKYFQMEVTGEENLINSAESNCMFVMNHTAFFGLEVYLWASYLLTVDPDQKLKTLVWSGFTNGPAGMWFRALQCKPAKIQNGIDLLKSGNSVLIMPEGVGATDVRNRFNHFHTGFLRMVQGHPVPIIPIGFNSPIKVGYDLSR
ncbi:MAG: 1-acyl-sn-glycerol-3-phosphate acyltransferase [SAR324 cluster bacterium]|nr:1-acyl-sn-glycerol-3-phosphate acyltransferase [SAR324 cluster bacterium]